LIHAESASRGKDQTPEKRARAVREQQGFIDRWSKAGQSDPHYHPALSLDYLSGPYGGLAMPCRSNRLRQPEKTAEFNTKFFNRVTPPQRS
jgi:hypothetical protein